MNIVVDGGQAQNVAGSEVLISILYNFPDSIISYMLPRPS
jgi:hypothetical protein